MRCLTARQGQILDYLIGHLLREHCPPTYRALAKALRIRSTNGVNDHLKALERKGFIATGVANSFAIRILRWPDGRAFRLEARACAPNECPACGLDTGGGTHHCAGPSPARA